MSVKLFLIRHGQTIWNAEGKYQGDVDVELTNFGIKQAKLMAKYLSRVHFSSIYSSPLRRALDTARIIAKGRKREVIIRENLKELNFGKWEGLKFDEISKFYGSEYKKWLDNPFKNTPPGGESFSSLTERSSKEIHRIIDENEDGSNVAVVTHGGVITSLLIFWLKIPVERWRSLIQRQGAINIVVVDDGYPYISQINFTGYLADAYNHAEDKVIEIYADLKRSILNLKR
ncbi:MAG: alpha-ribazole phosphatase [Actinobacteria bacterium]|nr:alpha-ribazole phosphatase [Actinomycetota bacterium]